MAGSVVITDDNVAEVLRELETAKERGLAKIGLAAVGYTRENTPVRRGVLRDAWASEVVPDEDAVYVGDLISKYPEGEEPYGKYVENGSRNNKAVHMLRDAATQHSDEYRKIMERELKG